ncbi:unnamed protein product [Sphagnum jensenii]|uniref:Band 7 domain-containing protein n=1 Tax=Sphagnum jensenii TaxID=128206 RepID=A0ABP1A7D5_9BRYO
MHPRSCLPPAAATKSAAAAAAVVAAFAERVLHFQGGSCAEAIACCGCLACVEQSTVGMVEKWGRFSYVAQAGLHCLNPVLGEWMAGRLSLRVQSLDVRCDTKTKDNVFVAVVYSIQCRVPRMTLDDVFEQKDETAKAVSEELKKTIIIDIDPNQSVRQAMNEINDAAQWLRMAAVEKAEAGKILQVKKIEGKAEAKYLSKYGITRQHQAIIEGLPESVLAFSNNVLRTLAKGVMDLVWVIQYFDTMKEIGNISQNTIVFLPHGPSHVGDITSQIWNGLMQGSAVDTSS